MTIRNIFPLNRLLLLQGTISAVAMSKPMEGCDDYGFARESEPWEKSEGGIYLLRELSAVAPDRAAKFLPVLVQLVHFQMN